MGKDSLRRLGLKAPQQTNRQRWPDWSETGGRFDSEMGGRIGPKRVAALLRNMHFIGGYTWSKVAVVRRVSKMRLIKAKLSMEHLYLERYPQDCYLSNFGAFKLKRLGVFEGLGFYEVIAFYQKLVHPAHYFE